MAELLSVCSGKNRSALRMAERDHRGQTRKQDPDVPYITHPIAVAEVAAQVGAPLNTIMACLLHDVVEDSEIEINDIFVEFGVEVAALVSSVTKPNHTRVRLEDQAQAIMDQLSSTAFPGAIGPDHVYLEPFVVKGSDLLINMSDLVFDAEERGPRCFDDIFGPDRVERKIGHYLRLARMIRIKLRGTRYRNLSKALVSRSLELEKHLRSYLDIDQAMADFYQIRDEDSGLGVTLHGWSYES